MDSARSVTLSANSATRMGRILQRNALVVAIVALTACARSNANSSPEADAPDRAPPRHTPIPAASGSVADAGTGSAGRVLRFAWRPPGGLPEEYEMVDAADRHRIVLPPGTTRRARLPVMIALHGQPPRNQAPRSYRFPTVVARAAEALWTNGDVPPFILALPVFRFVGVNWPAFDLVLFRKALERQLAAEGIEASQYYVVGHSAAAGCGGQGMNGAHRLKPAAVGFFDTCVGPGFRSEVRALRKARVPTLLAHSVETAGFRPRQRREYMTTFDFGKVFAPLGLAPSACPERLPDAPLRAQPFRCAADGEQVARALVLDTGEGEAGHNAVVPVAFAYFVREYLSAR